jgi:hypothetical protein
MKKNINTILIFLLLIHATTAQTVSNKSVQKGTVITTPYYGFPNFLTATLKNANEVINQEKEQLHPIGFGPVGMSASYLVTDNLAVGGEVSYASARIQWKEHETLQVADSAGIPRTYHFVLQAQRIRILIKLNYHFAITQHSDWYLDMGLGYNHTPIKLVTDAPFHDHDISSLCFLPLSAQTNLGFSYYFTKNIGVNAQVGIGGPLVAVGVTAKFL